MSYNTLQILTLIKKTTLDQTKYQYQFAMVYEQECYIIKKTTLDQTKDQYLFATVYGQECSIYSFIQNTLNNEQWYEQFSTNIDVGSDIGVTRKYQVILSQTTEESNKNFKDMRSEAKKRDRGIYGGTLPILNFSQAER